MAVKDWREYASRIDVLLATAGNDGEELVRTVADLYGAGLERMLELLHERGALTDEVLDALAGDDLVAGLLLVHGLHPHDAPTRIGLAIRGTGVELIEVTADGVCRLRAAHGHRPHGIEQLIDAVAPEITAVEIETPKPLIPVSALFSRPTS
ncbi:hypothetical protein [Paractinoplanes globisporus]|uniref:Uncharacterized protein n=1 Tax=Paractinoplanes globisporus TaxID=113565 RepID=A0ABW6WDP7_9ACTN|nr:hypothetical protein [Actinoplanes globisporus]